MTKEKSSKGLNKYLQNIPNKFVNTSAPSDATKVIKKLKPRNAKLVTQEELDEREAKARRDRIAVSNAVQPYMFNSPKNLAVASSAAGDKLRFSEYPNVFDDYFNPAAMFGHLASGLGQIPLNIQEGNYGQAAMNFANPVIAGAAEAVVSPLISKGLSAGKKAVKSAIDKNFTEVGKQLAQIEKEGIAKGLSPHEIKMQQMDQVGITSAQREGYIPGISDFAYKYITPQGYVGKGGESKFSQILENYRKGGVNYKHVELDPNLPYTGQYYNIADVPRPREDAWRLYLGMPQKYGTFEIAQTAPIEHVAYTPKQLSNLELFSLSSPEAKTGLFPEISPEGFDPYLGGGLRFMKSDNTRIFRYLDNPVTVERNNVIMGGHNKRLTRAGLEYNDIWDLEPEITPYNHLPRNLKIKFDESPLFFKTTPSGAQSLRSFKIPVDKFLGKPFMTHGLEQGLSSEGTVNMMKGITSDRLNFLKSQIESYDKTKDPKFLIDEWDSPINYNELKSNVSHLQNNLEYLNQYPKYKEGGWLDKFDVGGDVVETDATRTNKPAPQKLMTEEQKKRAVRREQAQRRHDAKELAKNVAKNQTYLSADNVPADVRERYRADREKNQYMLNSPFAQTLGSLTPTGYNPTAGGIAANQFMKTTPAIAAGAIAGPAILPYIGAAMEAPIAGVAGLTANNLMNVGFAAEAINNIPNVKQSFVNAYNNPTLLNIADATGEAGLTSLGLLPFASESLSGAKYLANASKESRLLSNTASASGASSATGSPSFNINNPKTYFFLEKNRMIDPQNINVVSGIKQGDVVPLNEFLKPGQQGGISEVNFFSTLNKGAGSLDRSLQKRIADLESTEGFQRLVNQEKEYFSSSTGMTPREIDVAAKNSARARIYELQNTANTNREAGNYMSSDFEDLKPYFLGNSNLYDNAFFISGSGRDVVEPVTTGASSFNLSKNTIPPISYTQALPGRIGMGYNYVNNVPVEMHEIAHGLQSGRVLPIDNELRQIIPSEKLDTDAAKAYKYFRKGSKGKEPSAFANELRESMFQKGLIPDYYSPISEKQLESAYNYFKRNPMGVYDLNHNTWHSNTRIFDFMDPNKQNFKLLTNIFNKLPSTAIGAGAIGVGANALGETPTPEQQRNGGWLDKFDVGGEVETPKTSQRTVVFNNDTLTLPKNSYVKHRTDAEKSRLKATSDDKEINKAADWLTNWYSSPGANRRLSESLTTANPRQVLQDVKDNINNVYVLRNYGQEMFDDDILNAWKNPDATKKSFSDKFALSRAQQEASNNRKELDNSYGIGSSYTAGFHQPFGHMINITEGIDPEQVKGTAVHELTHAGNLDKYYNAVGKSILNKYPYVKSGGMSLFPMNTKSKEFQKDSDYIKKDGAYPRLMEMRYNSKINPNQVITPKQFEKIKAQNPKNDLFRYYTDHDIINMLNHFAANDNPVQSDVMQAEYGAELNYNDYSVSAPEGFRGDGYSNEGRNYSPAWGGQFDNGGELPNVTVKGKRQPIIVTDPNDPRLRAYQDSLGLYNQSKDTELKISKIFANGYKRAGFSKSSIDKELFEGKDIVLHPEKYTKKQKGYVDSKLKKYNKKGLYYESFPGEEYLGTLQYPATIKNLIKYNKEDIASRNPNLLDTDINGLTEKERIEIAKIANAGLQKQYNIIKKTGYDPTYFIPNGERPPTFIFKKPTQPVVYQSEPERVNQKETPELKDLPMGLPVDISLPELQRQKGPIRYTMGRPLFKGGPQTDYYTPIDEAGNVVNTPEFKTSQFEDGGPIKRFLQPTQTFMNFGYNPRENGLSTEYSTTVGKDGEYYLVPGYKQGRLVEYPEDLFNQTGEHLGGPFKTIQSAEDFANFRHKYVEQNKNIPSPFKTRDYAMGGSLPGATGSMYAREGAPRNFGGKKTMPSAEDGIELKEGEETQPVKTPAIKSEVRRKAEEEIMNRAPLDIIEEGRSKFRFNMLQDAVKHDMAIEQGVGLDDINKKDLKKKTMELLLNREKQLANPRVEFVEDYKPFGQPALGYYDRTNPNATISLTGLLDKYDIDEFGNTVRHEFRHAYDDGGRYLTNYEKELISRKTNANNVEKQKALGIDTYNYLKDPTEVTARLQEVRGALKDNPRIVDDLKRDRLSPNQLHEELYNVDELGYYIDKESKKRIPVQKTYNPKTDNAKLEDIMFLKTMATSGLNDLLKIMSPQDVADLLNTIAANSPQQGMPVAQNGMEMKYYQDGLDFKPKSMKQGGQLTKLDQLTNFTNYNTKQPGGWLDKYQD